MSDKYASTDKADRVEEQLSKYTKEPQDSFGFPETEKAIRLVIRQLHEECDWENHKVFNINYNTFLGEVSVNPDLYGGVSKGSNQHEL